MDNDAPTNSGSPTDNDSATDDTSNREARLQSVVEAVRTNSLSLRAAAKQFGLPHTSISNRLHGCKAPSIAHESQQLLSNEQRKVLVEWCRLRGNTGNPMTHTQLSALIFDMTERTPSTNWICKFVQKNADQITKKRAHGLDPKRAQAVMVCPPILHTPPRPRSRLRWSDPFPTLSDRPPTPLGRRPTSHSLSRTLICFY